MSLDIAKQNSDKLARRQHTLPPFCRVLTVQVSDLLGMPMPGPHSYMGGCQKLAPKSSACFAPITFRKRMVSLTSAKPKGTNLIRQALRNKNQPLDLKVQKAYLPSGRSAIHQLFQEFIYPDQTTALAWLQYLPRFANPRTSQQWRSTVRVRHNKRGSTTHGTSCRAF